MTEDKKRGNNHSNDDPSNKPPNSTKPADKNNTDTPSLASRIQSSASGLARQAFSAPGSSGDAAQFLTTGSKASTSSSSALAAAEHYNQVSGPSAPSSAGAQLRDSNAGTFRSTTTPQQGGFEIPHLSEEEFAQTGNDFLEPSTSTSTTIDKGKGKAREEVSSISHTHAPEPTDGSAVISLLSDRTFDPTFPHDPAEIIETELLPPQQLTQTEIQMLESFRRHITPQPDTASPSTHRLTSASLVPEIDTILDSAPALTDTDAATLRDCVLASLPGSEDWVDVEERYHDEVWGWLKPTLEAAARELEEKEDPRGEDGPAVQRLKTVLTHMRAKL
ncbi:hypothetical protein BDV32DRAFT_115273 [Aspergillus pseudonomiae]|uniref:Uncharacterized protein n=1 Tax=Aspergillus pseudonomiae TaxID=1506151 RepID=A0A5N7DSR5_9EURO|nr:uncharacterized protein BDV37DRAFT_141673 [Aspergillus pseudonomiae]KAB8266217.1 hypothetical protein BDV32DRAFT_115273 [Aspergillus pseudonomiae]KAE8409083.1 hypothetical protein BDV37DRAFT_141673 [Aspergillus pseudonomiae]